MNLRQIEGVDEHIAKTLVFTGLRSLRHLASTSPEYLNQCIGRDLQFCASVVAKAASITDFSLSVLVRTEGIRIAVENRTASPHEASGEDEQSCTLLIWTSDQLLLFRESVRIGTIFDVAVTNAMMEKHRTVSVQLFHEQYAGVDLRLNVALDERGEHRSTISGNSRRSAKPTEALESKEPSSIQDGDSKLLKAIKKLERHHKSAKQQSMFQYLRCVSESEATATSGAQVDRFIEAKAARRIPATLRTEQLALCTPSAASHGDNVGYSARASAGHVRTSCTPLHVISPDDTVDIEDSTTQAQIHGAGRRKRKDGENLFAHFRFQKKPVVMLDVRVPSDVLSSKGGDTFAESSQVVMKRSHSQRSRSMTGKSRTSQPRTTGRAAKIHFAEKEIPISSIRSRPFFKAFLQEKVSRTCAIDKEIQALSSCSWFLPAEIPGRATIDLQAAHSFDALDRGRHADASPPPLNAS